MISLSLLSLYPNLIAGHTYYLMVTFYADGSTYSQGQTLFAYDENTLKSKRASTVSEKRSVLALYFVPYGSNSLCT